MVNRGMQEGESSHRGGRQNGIVQSYLEPHLLLFQSWKATSEAGGEEPAETLQCSWFQVMWLSSRNMHQAKGNQRWPLPAKSHYPSNFTSQRPQSHICDKVCQRMLPEVEEKVRLCVTEAHLHNLHLKLVLDDWVKNHLIPIGVIQEGVIQATPSGYDRTYFPTTKDLCKLHNRQ